MPRITYGERCWDVEPGATLLDTLLERGVTIAHGCRSGACRSCIMVALDGRPPATAQAGFSTAERNQGLFLACQCTPEQDLVVADASERLEVPAHVSSVEFLTERVVRLRIRCESPFAYVPGQFVTLLPEPGLGRSYSLASLPRDGELEFHVLLMPGGRMSNWVAQQARVGVPLRVRGPYGQCCYDPERIDLDAPLLLAGTGTGLAPLFGIVRDALERGHRGPIALHHGARTSDGLYLHALLRSLAAERPNVDYRAYVLEGDPPEGGCGACLDAAAVQRGLATDRAISDYNVFLCGAPEFVNGLRRKLFLTGFSLAKIHADAFVSAPPPKAE